MTKSPLAGAVEKFSAITHSFSDLDLEREWAWGAYDEGVRFAFFRVYEDLRELAARLAAGRSANGPATTTAQYILAQHHTAFRDLQAVLLGITGEDALREPGDEEWPLITTLLHIVQAEKTFHAVNHYAIERARVKDQRPLEMPEETWQDYWTSDAFEEVKESQSLGRLMEYYGELHWRVVHDFSGVQGDELSTPAVFWEGEPMPVEFRLHRFDSHLRQHTIQVEKTLDLLEMDPNEAKRLLRLIYTALAEVEGTAIGAPQFGLEQRTALAGKITDRADEIGGLVGV